ncbi:hypothetical protein B9Z55_021335 [Caenorhabditis nigoni]|nr:hypothetical protein B9Z55_021335 [Caenorhabditis nigoni]
MSALLYIPIMISVHKMFNLRSVQESKPQIYIFWQTMTAVIVKIIHTSSFMYTLSGDLKMMMLFIRGSPKRTMVPITPPTPTRKRPPSITWLFFQKPSDPKASHIRCSACPALIAYGGTTTGIIGHLKNRHFEIYQQLEKRMKMDDSVEVEESDASDVLARSFATGLIPFRFSENPEFRKFVKIVSNGRITMPNGRKIKNSIHKQAVNHLEMISKKVQNVRKFTILTDGYTNLKRDFHFYVLHIAFVNEYFEREILFCSIRTVPKGDAISIGSAICTMLAEIGLKISDCTAFATDAGSPLVSLAKNHQIERVHCSCHFFDLIIKDFAKVKSIQKIQEKAQEFARYLAKHREDKKRLKTMSMENGIEEPVPLPLPETRWAGIYSILKNFLAHYATLKELSTLQRFILKPEQIELMEHTVELLKPLHDAIMQLERDSSFASEVLPTIQWVKNKISNPTTTTTLSGKMKQIFDSRTKIMYNNRRLLCSCLLDHRFAYNLDILASWEWELAENYLKLYDKTEITTHTPPPTIPRDDTLDNFFLSSAGKKQIDDLKTDLTSYKALMGSNRPSTSSPLTFWASNQNNFPFLAPIASELLSTPASAATCERTFSRCSDFLRQPKRNRASVETLNSLLTVSEMARSQRQTSNVFDSDDDEVTEEEETEFSVWREESEEIPAEIPQETESEESNQAQIPPEFEEEGGESG